MSIDLSFIPLSIFLYFIGKIGVMFVKGLVDGKISFFEDDKIKISEPDLWIYGIPKKEKSKPKKGAGK